jgi:hypothetical protein
MSLSEVIGAVCRCLGIYAKDLTRPTRQTRIAQARWLIGYQHW